MIVTAGKTNVSVYFYIVQDASATSPGEPVTGLLFSDIETGGSASYVRQGALRTDLTLITLSGASATHADGGFILVDDTNMPGLYRCDYPDAAFATAVDQVMLQIVVASGKNAVASPIFVEITDVDFRDSIRGGMTALPNAAADGVGGLPISDAGGLDMDGMNTNINDIETDTAAMQPIVAKIPLSDGVITWNSTALASINAECDTALTDYDAATGTEMATAQSDLDIITGAAGALLDSTSTSAQLVDDIWDEVLTGATHNVATSAGRRLRTLQDFGVYEGGFVWLDTVNGVAGTVDFENGTVNNPSDLLASAITIMNSVGLPGIHAIPGSVLTLAATINAKEIEGVGYDLALGGQNIDNMHFFNSKSVTGIGTAATEMNFTNCRIGTVSFQKAICQACSFSGTVTMTLAGDYRYINCQSGVAGSGSPTFTKTAGQTITAEWRRWANGITVSGIESGDTMTINGILGAITLNGANGTVEIRGTYKSITDNRTGAPVLNKDGAIKGSDVADILVDTAVIGAAGAGLTDLGGMSTGMKAEVLVEVVKLLITQMTESYAADGTAPTLAQSLMLVQQSLHEFSIAGTTRTVKKLDGAATAATFTLDDATNPTSTTRTT